MKKIDRRSVLAATAAGAALAMTHGARAQGAPIRIGSTLALTGPLSATGLTHKLVGDIYIEQLNARGGLIKSVNIYPSEK
jgi:branched-chain amino acid transport system substrate-binding protein